RLSPDPHPPRPCSPVCRCHGDEHAGRHHVRDRLRGELSERDAGDAHGHAGYGLRFHGLERRRLHRHRLMHGDPDRRHHRHRHLHPDLYPHRHRDRDRQRDGDEYARRNHVRDELLGELSHRDAGNAHGHAGHGRHFQWLERRSLHWHRLLHGDLDRGHHGHRHFYPDLPPHGQQGGVG